MCTFFLLVGLFLLTPMAVAHAEDAGVVAAALPDEASECRYLTQLCQDGRNALVNKNMSVRQKMEKIKKAADAARVIRVKHETMPPCFKVCEGLLDMSKLQ